jgi:TolB protein
MPRDNREIIHATLFMSKFCQILLAFVLLILNVTPTHGQSPPTGERIAFSAYRNGQWDIYSIAPDGSDLRQLTNDSFEDRDPAYSPDGTKLAFASRRDKNWDIYILDLLAGSEIRLTSSPHYDGAPAWHPEGNLVAYESYQAGNLDIWLVDAGGREAAVNLTADTLDPTDLPAGDFAPAWSPDGKAIAFTSWRSGNKDLFMLDMATGVTIQLTNHPAAEDWPTWHSDGGRLAFVRDDLGDREIYTLNLATLPVNDGPVQTVTWLGRADSPAWSPGGETIAALFYRWDGETLTINRTTPDAGHQLPHILTDVATIQGRLSWSGQAVEFGRPLPTLANAETSPLYEERLTLNQDETTPYSLVRQNDLVVGTPWLADTVDDSFQAWRLRLRDEVRYDFLRELSDVTRDLGSYTETSQYASWHKSGRAIDMLFDYYHNGQLFHELIREDYSGETYWRIMLRCLDQTGRCGRPLTANPWNYSQRARTEVAPEQGGIEKANISGYYVDLTALAREYGWERISSYDDNEYSWTWHFIALEYWHYQKRLKSDGLAGATNWYQAMRHIYPQETLDQYFNWEKMRALDEDPHLIALKGVPLPLEMRPWWALVEQ